MRRENGICRTGQTPAAGTGLRAVQGGIMPCRSYVNGNHVNGNKLEQGMAQRAVPAFR